MSAPVLSSACREIFDVAGVENVIVIGESDVFAMGDVQTGILCFGYAPVGLVDYGDAIVFCGVFVTY